MAAIASIFGSFIQGGFSALNESVNAGVQRDLFNRQLVNQDKVAIATTEQTQKYLTIGLVAVSVGLVVYFLRKQI